MLRIILNHWAFQAYVIWMLVVVAVILWHKGRVGSVLKKWWHKHRVSAPTTKLKAAATYQSENTVEDARMKAVKICSSSCPDREETKRWTSELRGATAEAVVDSR